MFGLLGVMFAIHLKWKAEHAAEVTKHQTELDIKMNHFDVELAKWEKTYHCNTCGERFIVDDI